MLAAWPWNGVKLQRRPISAHIIGQRPVHDLQIIDITPFKQVRRMSISADNHIPCFDHAPLSTINSPELILFSSSEFLHWRPRVKLGLACCECSFEVGSGQFVGMERSSGTNRVSGGSVDAGDLCI